MSSATMRMMLGFAVEGLSAARRFASGMNSNGINTSKVGLMIAHYSISFSMSEESSCYLNGDAAKHHGQRTRDGRRMRRTPHSISGHCFWQLARQNKTHRLAINRSINAKTS